MAFAAGTRVDSCEIPGAIGACAMSARGRSARATRVALQGAGVGLRAT
jgi:hypothetical protein